MTRLASFVITLFTAPLLCLIAVRLVMSPLFLQFEYNRPGFPEDPYGFTTTDRFLYAPYALDYLLNAESISFLGNLKFPDGKALFNTRELHHMRDVKFVTQIAFLIALGIGIVYIAAVIGLYRKRREVLHNALHRGGVVTLALIATIVIFAFAAWDRFFVLFHQIFFTDGTWYFPTSDTLIRLFPEQFWFDAALSIGAIAVLGALLLLGLAYLMRRQGIKSSL